jgi:PAS domain S-box-containing protein
MSQKQNEILQRALTRERLARKQAEKILEEKSSELFEISQKLKESNFQLGNIVNQKTSELEGVFENIIDAYVVMDIYGNVLKLNDAAVELLGLDDLNHKINLLDLTHPNELKRTARAFKNLLDKGSLTDFIVKIITKEDIIKLVHVNCSVIYKNNKAIAIQGIVRDITSNHIQEELIQEQKKELDVIVNNSSIGIVLTQLGRIVRTNEKFQDMLGFTEEELSSFSIKDLTTVEDFPESKDNIDRMNAGEIDNFTINKRYKKKDGSIIWAKTNVNAVRDNNNEIKYQVALVEDITSERERTLILDLINNLTKSILGKTDINEIAWEIVHNIAEYLDSEDCVIYLVNHNNETMEQIAAYGGKLDNEKKIINSMVLKIGQGIVGNVVKTATSEIIKDTSKDHRYIADNERRFSEIAVPIINEGRVIAIIDSEHKDKNHYTNEHLKTLESIASLVAIQLRTALNIRKRKKVEARNEQLLKELEKSNDELQEYAHIVSHDLKSPLRSINALVSWIKEDNAGSFDKASLQNFNLIEMTLEKMEQLISDILLYSSIDAETIEKQEVDLNILIDELRQILFIPNHITIRISRKLPIVIGERAKLQQLFQNLISNAITFNDKEKGLIELDVLDEKTFYQFSIKDNGQGIDKKYHNKIFKIFHSLKKNKKSSGIGLSIVKKIVDLYEGEVWLESEPNKGTTFFFTLKKQIDEDCTVKKTKR